MDIFTNIINALVEDGYVVIENALKSSLCESLLKSAKNAKNYKKAGMSKSDNLHINTKRRGDQIVWLNEDSACQSEYLLFIHKLSESLNRSLYLGLSYYEAHFSHYEAGTFYEKHLDAFKNSKNRVITSLYYLNEEWSQEDGGELLLYDENNNLLKTIYPQKNTFVVFLSEKFPHEVKVCKKSRYSIAGWFRVDKR